MWAGRVYCQALSGRCLNAERNHVYYMAGNQLWLRESRGCYVGVDRDSCIIELAINQKKSQKYWLIQYTDVLSRRKAHDGSGEH